MNFIKHTFLLFLSFILIFSCKKEKTEIEDNPPIPDKMQHGILVLNEGLFQLNNSSLSWIDLGKNEVNNDFFTDKTGRLLGDTGNDMKRYGGKIYIVVNVSSTIEVLNVSDGKSIKQIPMLNGSAAKQPRFIDFYGGFAYVSCFDGYVDVIDTVNLEVTKRIKVGLNPDYLLVANGKIFVSNSGGLNTPQMDSTVSVINPSSQMEESKITVGLNPGKLATDSEGNLFVVARGNYTSVPSRLKKINLQNESSENTVDFSVSGVVRMKNKLLLPYFDANEQKTKIALYNSTTSAIENSNYLDISLIQTFHGLKYDEANDNIHVFDAMGYTNTGYLRIFNASGTLLNTFHVGLNPTSLLVF